MAARAGTQVAVSQAAAAATLPLQPAPSIAALQPCPTSPSHSRWCVAQRKAFTAAPSTASCATVRGALCGRRRRHLAQPDRL